MRLRTYETYRHGNKRTVFSYNPLIWLILGPALVITVPIWGPFWLLFARLRAISRSQQRHNAQVRAARSPRSPRRPAQVAEPPAGTVSADGRYQWVGHRWTVRASNPRP
jgi:hypothetical protein